MPTLKQVLPGRVLKQETLSGLGNLLELRVTAIKLSTGSPCSGKDELFAPWPGEERHVRQWFLLSDGHAVGVDEDPSGDWRCAVVEPGR